MQVSLQLLFCENESRIIPIIIKLMMYDRK